jgi:hypothetical protein
MPAFPDPCGFAFAEAVARGADPEKVVPNEYLVVYGGGAPIRAGVISCTVGPTLIAAAAAVPHGRIRWTTVGRIREKGGIVNWRPELSREKTLNQQHVNVSMLDISDFSDLEPNPVPRRDRIDGTLS